MADRRFTEAEVVRGARALKEQHEAWRTAADGGYDHPPGFRGMARAVLDASGARPEAACESVAKERDKMRSALERIAAADDRPVVAGYKHVRVLKNMALAALADTEPPCATCGGTGRIHAPTLTNAGARKPCPVCSLGSERGEGE